MAKKFNPHKYTYHFNIGHNIKLGEGVASWSTLKGSDLLYIPRLEKRVRGTCKDCDYCTKDCYVNKSYRRVRPRCSKTCTVNCPSQSDSMLCVSIRAATLKICRNLKCGFPSRCCTPVSLSTCTQNVSIWRLNSSRITRSQRISISIFQFGMNTG